MKTKLFKKLSLLLVVAIVASFTCVTAFADSSEVRIYLDGNQIADYNTTYLDSLVSNNTIVYDANQCFSSHKCNGTFTKTYASGYDLEDVLNLALASYSKDVDDIDTIEFASNDNYTSGEVDMNSVLTGKYFDTVTDTTGDPILPIIAKVYGTTVTTQTSLYCLRNFHGQQAATDNAIEDWTKNLYTIYLTSN